MLNESQYLSLLLTAIGIVCMAVGLAIVGGGVYVFSFGVLLLVLDFVLDIRRNPEKDHPLPSNPFVKEEDDRKV